MTICVMRYISDLRIGRVNPQHFNFDINVADKKYDLAEFVSDNAVDATDVPALIRKVEPDSDQYRATEAALAHYLDPRPTAGRRRRAAAARGARRPASASPANTPPPASLLARLQLEGDAPGDYPYHARRPRRNRSPRSPPAAAVARSTRAAVRSADNRRRPTSPASPGEARWPMPQPPPTAAVRAARASTRRICRRSTPPRWPMRSRTTSIATASPRTAASPRKPSRASTSRSPSASSSLQDSLERWRWLPNQYVNAPLMVNLPEFVLRGYNPQHQLDFTMRVVVGKVVGDHDTPVFAHMMRYLIFRPYWNVPHDIVEKELMPHIRASGVGYLASQELRGDRQQGQQC